MPTNDLAMDAWRDAQRAAMPDPTALEHAQQLADAGRRIAELEARLITTYVACAAGCGRGVRDRDAVLGLCRDCAEQELSRLRAAR